MIITNRMRIPTTRHMRIFMSFHHICLRTRLAPLRKPWADTARLSVLSCSESRRAPRSETLLMLSRMMPTVLSISCRASQHMDVLCQETIRRSLRSLRSLRGTHQHRRRRGSVLWDMGPCAVGVASLPTGLTAWRPRLRCACADNRSSHRSLPLLRGKTAVTYRLESGSAVVAILALTAGGGARGDIRIVRRLLAGRHGWRG